MYSSEQVHFNLRIQKNALKRFIEKGYGFSLPGSVFSGFSIPRVHDIL